MNHAMLFCHVQDFISIFEDCTCLQQNVLLRIDMILDVVLNTMISSADKLLCLVQDGLVLVHTHVHALRAPVAVLDPGTSTN